MKTFSSAKLLLMLCAVFISSSFCRAQTLDNPGTYMTALSNAQLEMEQTYMAYMSAVAHTTKAKKIEKMRQKTLESITNARYKVIELPIYKGDNSLRQGSIDYILFCYNVFNENYAKIVDLGEIAEQSFDEMQAYLLLKEKTNEKLHEGSEKLKNTETAFAAKYNVTLIDSKSELGEKMNTAGKLNRYHDEVYLIFFKCNWQDNQIVEAMNKKKITGMEQSRNALISYAKEGLKALDTVKSFEGDGSLLQACKKSMNDYKKMAENDLPKLLDFYLKEDNFNKLKKAFEQKDESSLTKEEVKAYNTALADMNKSIDGFNQTNTKMNETRNAIINNWNSTEKTFLDTHMPYYKK